MKKLNSIGLCSVICSMIFSGCSSSESKNKDNPQQTQPQYQKISGVVSDPEIKGSHVRVCLKNDPTNCLLYNTDITDENGAFKITNIANDINLSEYVVFANGGTDIKTGESFDDLNLSIPVDVIENNTTIISPLTTLLHSNNWSLSQLAANLDLNTTEVLKNPNSSKKLQKKALLITNIAKKRSQGFKNFSIEEGNFSRFIDSDISLTQADKQDINITLSFLDQNTSNSSDIVNNYNTIKLVLKSDLFQDANKTNPLLLSNSKKWANKILSTSKKADLSQPNIEQLKAILTLIGDLDLESEDLNISDINISGKNLKNILPRDAILNHKVELPTALGDDDITGTKTREYYFASNISHLNQAEKIIENMNDVSFTDSIYVDLAYGYILNNKADIALSIANNKVFQKENKADIFRLLGEHLITKDNSRANELFDKAFDLYKTVIQARGQEAISEDDIKDLAKLFHNYTLSNNTQKADEIHSYLTDKKSEFSSGSDYAVFANAYRKLADKLLEQGEKNTAISILNQGYEYLKDMPIFYLKKDPHNAQKASHSLKVIYFVQIATRLAQAGDTQKATEIIDAVQALRLDDGSTTNGVYNRVYNSANKYDTSYKTYSQVDDMVAVYSLCSQTEKALALIPTIVKTNKEEDSYREYAKGLAGSGNIEAAFSVIDNNITTYKNKIKALTYNGINKSGDYIAQFLINNNNNVDAKRAIDKAVDILDQAIIDKKESSDLNKRLHYVSYGYAKLANLYAQIDQTSKSKELFTKSIAIADGSYNDANNSIVINDKNIQVEALANIGYHLHQVGFSSEVTKIIAKAANIASSISDQDDKVEAFIDITTIAFDDREDKDVYGNYPSKESLVLDPLTQLITEKESDVTTIDTFITISKVLSVINRQDKAKVVLQKALDQANALSKASTKMSKLKVIIQNYAKLGDVQKAQEIISSITYKGDKREARALLAEKIYTYDSFLYSDIASVDTDNDSKPDFFNVDATAEEIEASGLILDEDNDGDTHLNSTDLTPYFYSN